MGIQFDEKQRIFHLQGKATSYVIQLERDGYVTHQYWGRKIRKFRNSNRQQYIDRSFSPNPYYRDRTFSLDNLPQEYPQYGNSDFRKPAYHIQLENGSTVTDLRYKSHRIYSGKPKLTALPATYAGQADAETLELVMQDEYLGLEVQLLYTVFSNYDVVTRSVQFHNKGKQKLKLLQASSVSVDFRRSDFDMLTFPGAWGKERHMEKRSLQAGIQSAESTRGASSHQQHPFIGLMEKHTTEDYGEVFGFHLVYSGNFLAQAEVDQFATTRVTLGINPFDFSWLLEPGATFQTPEAVLVYSSKGLGAMSDTLHRFYQQHLVRGEHKDKERPILINNWEATYFDFDADKIEQIAKAGSELGIELFVLDDGWFRNRNSDSTSLGDWFVDKKKLPNGLEDVAKRVNDFGMQFGLWLEPEMVSVDSELYREHPDWCLHVPDRYRTESRDQLVLDFSRADVRKEIIKRVSDILSSAPIGYVKWDMNRHLSEVGSASLPAERQRETAHRHMLGVYEVMEMLTSRFPHILFESCSGGGGRYDPGILYYMPQTWTSDNTDAVSRLKIQYATSLLYPVASMGSHVSDVPNHQVHRSTSLTMRGDVAMAGNLGYELDLTRLSKEEKQVVSQQIEFYKEIRSLVQFGQFYRLKSPFEGNETAWMFVNEDKSEAYVCYYRVLAEPAAPLAVLRVKGLDLSKDYSVWGTDEVYSGEELEYSGIRIPTALKGDFVSHTWYLRTE
ncbi:alpha-galactosidase [Terribacillus halophilus]|jgi:alpha-galactosidase|uniref:alpha-galactosidase n=1 Tax=Terribacillus halophilus TaxID=361279 RepID=UPI00098665AF|nr:alpha-galactosidase [Terribacillus halophilus]